MRGIWFTSLILALCFTICPFYSNGQIQVTPGNISPYTPENLISNIFLGEGVEVLDIQHQGTSNSVGFFSNGMTDIGMDRGIIMSTGTALTGATPNNDPGTSETTSNTSVVDSDLEMATDVDLFDITKYIITFTPVSDTLRFRYAFASEEYPEFTCSEFNDVFGFFITGPNPQGVDYDGTNIALVPGTNQTVAINNVHNGNPNNPDCFPINEQYYNDNFGSTSLTYDAYLDVFVAEALVVPCQEYTIKLAIGDGSDPDWDSAVFLEAKSFGTGTLRAETQTLSIDGGIAEGCVDGEIVFSLPSPPETDFLIDFLLINEGFPNIAVPGIDYFTFPPEIIIPAGSTTFQFPLRAYEDIFDEGVEYIYIDYQKNFCTRDTLRIPVYDNNLISPVLPFMDSTICEGEVILVDTEIPPELVIPEPPIFRNNTDLVIATANEAYYSDINVSNIRPDLLSNRIIKQVCIDSLHHRWLNDLDFYLVGPSGQIMELSTDNGEDGGNAVAEDSLINMCFSPSSITNINNGDPVAGDLFPGNFTYTGNYSPEGVWSDIWKGDFPSNGIWRLLVIDDVDDALIPVLHSWSICFESPYEINFEWGPNQDISCLDCEDPEVSPLNSTEYFLTTTDSYGCQVVDSLTVTVEEILTPPVISCDSISFDAVRITWNSVVDATGYEVSLDGSTWIPASGNLQHIFSSLSSDTDHIFQVRAIGGPCGGEAGQVICRTLLCLAPDIQLIGINEPTCFGGNDGTATFSASGTLGPYSFDLDGDMNNTGFFQDLSSGAYTVFVTDGDNCTIGRDFNISEPAEIELNESVSPISCFGANDGSISLNPSNGSPAYMYQWGGGENASSLTNLSAGWYYVTVTDSDLCMKMDSFEIMEPEGLQLTIDPIDVLCFGDNTGQATANPIGGFEPYNYLWNDGASQVTRTAVDLLAGNYMVTVTDLNGCTVEEIVEIDEPLELTLVADSNDLLCFDSNAGSASAMAEGGRIPYTYTWSTTQTGNMIDDLVPGTYMVTVVDANDCSAETSTTVNAPDEIELTISVGNTLCNGDNNGSIEFSAQGGVGQLEYLLDDIPVMSPATGLAASTYCITVLDENMCRKDSCVEVGEPDIIGNNAMISNVSCFASATGVIDLNPTGGSGTYTYSWTGPGLFTADTENITDLFAGDYFVTVTDNNNCTNEFQFSVDEPTQIDIFGNVIPVNCFGGDDGAIQLQIFGGEMPYEVNWSGPMSFSSQEQNIQNLTTGNYTLILTDGRGCVEMRNFEVLQPITPLVLNISEPDTICPGTSNGRASVMAQGGNGAYNYNWSSGGDGDNVMGLSDGIISVTVTDGGGCSEEVSTQVFELGAISLELNQTGADCFEGETGSAEIINISYGNLQANLSDFEFIWNSVPPQFTPLAENLTGGSNYSVIVEDSYGCTETAELTIDHPDPVLIKLIELNNASCNRGMDGSITVAGEGGVEPYNFEWDPSTNYQVGPTATDLRLGIYEVTVTDANGCTGTQNFAVDQPTQINLSFRVFDVFCFGEPEGEVSTIVSGGVQPYEYNWSTGSNEDVISDLTAGFYYLTLTDSNGCEIVDSTEIKQPEETLMLDFDVKDVSCFEGSDGGIAFIPSGGSGFYTFSIDGRIYNGSTERNGLQAGSYTIYVKDFKGCIDSIENVEIFEPAEILVDLGPDTTVLYGTDITLEALISNTIGSPSYEWNSDFEDKLSCFDCPDPTIFNVEEQMSFELNVTDENLCRGSDNINIYVRINKNLDVPLGFTPNNDGNNDLLVVYGSAEAVVNVFQVYSRWGEMVYELKNFDINDENIGWDGTFKGKDVNPGVFAWFAEATFKDGSVGSFKGHTNLIR